MRFSIAHESDIGTRSSNQDRVAYAENDNGVFMVIADGLGGYAGGELAAQTAVDCLISSFVNMGESLISDPAAFIVLSMTYAHTMIGRNARAEGMNVTEPRTTCVACLVQNGYAYWGHVGDSRLYLFGDRELLIRTVDHTTADHMHRDGVIDEHTQRLGHSQLFRCIGGTKKPVVSLGTETQLGTGDIILLCTDGIWRAFNEDELAKAINKDDLEDSVNDLLTRTRKYFRTECDNSTALVFRWEDKPTQHKALLNVTTSEMDQDSLSQGRRMGFDARAFTGADSGQKNEGIDTVIEEIETLVKEMDSIKRK